VLAERYEKSRENSGGSEDTVMKRVATSHYVFIKKPQNIYHD
jgi:hypothetical protein